MLYYINYSCGCGKNEEIISAKQIEDAINYAYIHAIREYEYYEGLYGIRSFVDILKEEFNVSIEDKEAEDHYEWAQDIYNEEIENTISYSAEEYNEKKHGWILEEQGIVYEI